MINSQHSDHLKNTKIELDKVSDSFCVAKWKQVTMHLQNGMNHSCHHPKAHVVPIEEIKKNGLVLGIIFKNSTAKVQNYNLGTIDERS